MLDLDAYLERIGLSGRPGLAEVHRAHVTAIPFENLDPHRGVAVSLEPEALEEKLVTRRRGGYCFEQNMLLAGALGALGMEVEPMLARVRLGAPPGTVRPRSHLVLRVRADGQVWLADVGFGGGAPLAPLPFEPDVVDEQAGWRFRLVPEGGYLVLQSADDDGWNDLYAVIPEPVPLIDIQTSNWFTATHPESKFVTGLIISAQSSEGHLTILSDWSGELTLAERSPGSEVVTPVARHAIPELLDARFGLPGFRVGSDGRVALDPV